jgi:glycerol uptake facilitator-like aquaporin
MIVLPYLTELLGTFLLILAVLASGGNAFIVGFTLMLIILLAGKVSGGHVNPAVSLAMLLGGSMTLMDFIAYISTHMAGSAAAYFTYRAML